jgi:hypothetical protein
MTDATQSSVVRQQGTEAVGETFDFEDFLNCRRATWRALNEIATAMSPVMLEVDARATAREILHQHGLGRGWHPTIVRFGPNTTKTFKAPSDRDVVLRHSDIFFVDIGPLQGDYEGDAGDTFVVGNDQELIRARDDVHAMWNVARSFWMNERATGRALYEYASTQAALRDWDLNLDLAGHRLSEFPHRAHFNGALACVDFTPGPNLWMLEIQIRHRNGGFGAFFEDLLSLDVPPDAENFDPTGHL